MLPLNENLIVPAISGVVNNESLCAPILSLSVLTSNEGNKTVDLN